MTLDQQLKLCRICTNRKMDAATGLVCSLTGNKPAFEGTCSTFNVDQPEADRLIALERAAQAEEAQGGSDGFSYERQGVSKGVLGGVVMLVIAGVWFFAGLAAGRIFFYPPILAVVGIYSIIKGLATGNYAGKK